MVHQGVARYRRATPRFFCRLMLFPSEWHRDRQIVYVEADLLKVVGRVPAAWQLEKMLIARRVWACRRRATIPRQTYLLEPRRYRKPQVPAGQDQEAQWDQQVQP